MARRNRKVNLDKPWAIRNAIACLEEVRGRSEQQGKMLMELGVLDAEQQVLLRIHESHVLAMDYAISIVESINVHVPPQQPDLKEELLAYAKEVLNESGSLFHLIGDKLEDVGHAWKRRYDYDDD